MGIGKDVGENAAKELDKTVHEAIPEAQQAMSQLIEQLRVAFVEGTGTLERASGAICYAAGHLPQQIVDALDGLTVTFTVSAKVSKKPIE